MNHDPQLTAAQRKTAERQARLRRTVGSAVGLALVGAMVIPPALSRSVARFDGRVLRALTSSAPQYSQEQLAKYEQVPAPIAPGDGADSAIQAVDPQIMGDREVLGELEEYVNHEAQPGKPFQPNEDVSVPKLPLPDTTAHQ